MRAAFRYAVSYWWNVIYVAGENAFAAIGWNHPRNAFLPLIVSIAAAAWVGYEQQDFQGFQTRAMIAVAGFATFIAFGVVAFVWQMIATPPRLDYEKSQTHTDEYGTLKDRLDGLSTTLSRSGEADNRVAFIRTELSRHADLGNGIDTVAEWAAWMHGAEGMVKGMAPKHFHTLHVGYPSGGRLDDGDWVLLDAESASLARSVASLKVIAASVTAADVA